MLCMSRVCTYMFNTLPITLRFKTRPSDEYFTNVESWREQRWDGKKSLRKFAFHLSPLRGKIDFPFFLTASQRALLRHKTLNIVDLHSYRNENTSDMENVY